MSSAFVSRVLRLLKTAAIALLFATLPLPAFHVQAAPPEHGHGAAPMGGAAGAAGGAVPTQSAQPARAGVDQHSGHDPAPPAASEEQMGMGATRGGTGAPMDMGAMQGGRAPADARDPDPMRTATRTRPFRALKGPTSSRSA